MDAIDNDREREKSQLLARLAELMVEEQRAQGLFDHTPHFSTLEKASWSLGQQLSAAALRQAARESAATDDSEAACPTCSRTCRIDTRTRTLHGLAGPVEVLEQVAHCPACRRDFFPPA